MMKAKAFVRGGVFDPSKQSNPDTPTVDQPMPQAQDGDSAASMDEKEVSIAKEAAARIGQLYILGEKPQIKVVKKQSASLDMPAPQLPVNSLTSH